MPTGIGDWFITLGDGSVAWVPSPRINVDAWMKFWRAATMSVGPGWGTAVSMAVEAALAITSASLDTLGDLSGSLPPPQEAHAVALRADVIAIRGELVPLVEIMLDTSDPSALSAGVLAPLLHGPGSIMQRAAEAANQVEQIAPDEVTWNWGGVFEGTTSLAPDPWNIYGGVGLRMSELLAELETSAPGEPDTVRDRLERAAKSAGRKAKKAGGILGSWLFVGAIAFVGGVLWSSRRR